MGWMRMSVQQQSMRIGPWAQRVLLLLSTVVSSTNAVVGRHHSGRADGWLVSTLKNRRRRRSDTQDWWTARGQAGTLKSMVARVLYGLWRAQRPEGLQRVQLRVQDSPY